MRIWTLEVDCRYLTRSSLKRVINRSQSNLNLHPAGIFYKQRDKLLAVIFL